MTMEETGNTQTVLKQTKAVRRSLDYLISLLHSGGGGVLFIYLGIVIFSYIYLI